MADDEEDQTVLSASSAEQGVAQKTHGARATDPGKDQGEANAHFVGNKLSLFFPLSMGAGRSSANGGISLMALRGLYGALRGEVVLEYGHQTD